MTGMSPTLEWSDVALRLALTVAAALVLGLNRSEHGKAAGLRTTLLVCLAASVAMLQVNLLLPTAGRQSDSFVMNDLMRLPLGILTGVGFIGGGAIFHRDNIVTGVTTAATLWLATVVGLCFGGGQNELGIAATALGLAALWPLGWIESLLPRERSAVLTIERQGSAPDEEEIRSQLHAAGFTVLGASTRIDAAKGCHEATFRLRRTKTPSDTSPPRLITAVAAEPDVISLEWRDAA
jgi:putative Mg2+ transporter-C (MgtC) family protein